MIHFIIPVRSRKVSKDWERVKKLCEGTLRSVYNQTSREYSVQVVCHEPPVDETNDRVTVRRVDFGIPSDKKQMMADKKKKVQVGAAEAPKEPGDYVMIVDADDRINKHLVSYVASSTTGDILFIERGYVWPYRRTCWFRWGGFLETCGSSHIIRYDGSNMPNGVGDDGEYAITTPLGEIETFSGEKGLERERVPFEGACYVTGVEDNWSGVSFTEYLHKKRFVRKVIGFRFLTSSVRDMFAIRN
jgi:hypothetical protein